MTVVIEGHVPSEATTLAILEDEARKSVRAAGELAVGAVRAIAPGGASGKIGTTTHAVVRKTATGAAVRVASTERKLVEWTNEGTGIYGGKHNVKIRGPKRQERRGALRTPWGPRASVKGQRGQQFIRRAQAGVDAEAEVALKAGAPRAARRIERA